jgi:hypothetical protein
MTSELRPMKRQPAASKRQWCSVSLQALFGDGLFRSSTNRGRVVADVVIAGQIAAGDGKRLMQGSRKIKFVRFCRSVERDVAAVKHKIGTPGVDVFADPMKIIGQRRDAAGKMGVGNLGQAKFGHAMASGPVIRRPDVGMMKPGRSDGRVGVVR